MYIFLHVDVKNMPHLIKSLVTLVPHDLLNTQMLHAHKLRHPKRYLLLNSVTHLQYGSRFQINHRLKR